MTADVECPSAPKKIFVIHPSPLVTDFQAHGDGLLAYRYIVELAARGHEVFVACESVRLSKPIPRNVTLYPIALASQRLGVLRRIEYAWKMRRLFRRLDRIVHFDVAHQFNPVYAGLSLGLVGINIPVVLGPYVSHWPSKRASKLRTIVLDAVSRLQQSFATAVIVSGPAARSRIVSKSISPDMTFVVPYGIDLAQFPERPLPAGDPVILYLAGLSARKGILTLLMAFDRVAVRLPAVRLVVAGDGPERDRVREAAAQSPFSARVSIVGSVARERVSDVLGQCTVYCSSSFGEPYGMSLVEAMATGRPVVATKAGGPVDLVDQHGGILVPPGDVHALADALIEVIVDPNRAGEMGSHNRRAVQAFAWPNVITKLENVYAYAVSMTSRRGGRLEQAERPPGQHENVAT